jgi:hypothetical protein
MENGNISLLAAKGNENGKLPFVCCKQKRKTEIGRQTINGN